MKILVLAALFLLVSCSAHKTKLDEKSKNIEVLSSKKNNGCHVVEKVIGENESGTEELALNHAKNLAIKAGGNAIYVEDTIKNAKTVRVHAIVFHCP